MAEIRRQARLGRELLRVFGPGWLAYRGGYALRQRAGLMERRLPATSWEEVSLGAQLVDPFLADPDLYFAYRCAKPATFFLAPEDRAAFAPTLRSWDRQAGNPRPAADAVLQGTFRYFSNATYDLGFPPDWHLNPMSGIRAPDQTHWSRIGEYHYGDVKLLWEPSRFSFTFDLVRAYWRQSYEEYAEAFWCLVEDWHGHNPPQRGVNWKCGQETSFRVMAWCFGLYGFLGAAPTTPQRVAMLAEMLAVSGHRIESNLGYALSQRNNHGISEATGLWTIGLLFPEFRHAARWRELGAKHLEALGRDLIYDDGAFVQHSTNYHRVMLHTYLWSLRLGDLNGHALSDELRARLARAGEFMYQIQDEDTGEVPFYGHNDGALVLPLNNCDSHDMRPVVQALSLLCAGARRYEGGPWDEDLLWLFGLEALHKPATGEHRVDFAAPRGGCFTLRSGNGFAFIRCPTFRARPAHADALHVDLWWRGQNVALDGGTYSYNAPSPWDHGLAGSASHNTVTVDGLDQMDRVGRFLWLPWIESRVLATARSAGGGIAYWEGEHDGYERLSDPVKHRRAVVQLSGERLLVLDSLWGQAHHTYRLHWLLPDMLFRWDEERGSVSLETSVGPYSLLVGTDGQDGHCSVMRASIDGVRGWRSRSYLERSPAVSVALTARGQGVCFWSVLGPPCTVSAPDDRRLRLEYEECKAEIRLANRLTAPLVSSIQLCGPHHDVLEP